MKKRIAVAGIISVLTIGLCGCAPLIVGGILGGVGAYAVSKDTIQGETDKPYESLWESAVKVARIRGTVRQEDVTKGYLELQTDSGRIWITLIRLTQATTRVKVSARRFHMPNIALAQDMFVKIMEQSQ
ncbi:MAG TPA: DUF3568 family protein [Patescibacteria group bacterium]|nr:DUF3568 family protein [Patescibacteria group bacterium]